MNVHVRLAEPGEGEAVVELASLALDGGFPQEGAGGNLKEGIDRYGGHLPVPYGTSSAFVADIDGSPVGLLYSCPPVRWIEEHEELSFQLRSQLGRHVAEIELLAVLPQVRECGVGTMLLTAWEERMRDAGTCLSVAKIRRGHYGVMLWYRKRGYRIVPQGMAMGVRVATVETTMSDGDDGYQLAARKLASPSAA